jgi:hypothetical protein
VKPPPCRRQFALRGGSYDGVPGPLLASDSANLATHSLQILTPRWPRYKGSRTGLPDKDVRYLLGALGSTVVMLDVGVKDGTQLPVAGAWLPRLVSVPR